MVAFGFLHEIAGDTVDEAGTSTALEQLSRISAEAGFVNVLDEADVSGWIVER